MREHAQASSVTVTLLERDGGYAVRIADDGCGFEPELAAPAVRPARASRACARACALGGGSLRVESAAGRGTTVEAWLPRRPTASSNGGPA